MLEQHCMQSILQYYFIYILYVMQNTTTWHIHYVGIIDVFLNNHVIHY